MLSGRRKLRSDHFADGEAGDGVICFDEFAELFKEQEVECLGPVRISGSRPGVFDALRAFDSKDAAQIYASAGQSGLGLAISNRLKKAAGFKTIALDRRGGHRHHGGTGSGKTSALEAIRDLGGRVIDCDEVYMRCSGQRRAAPCHRGEIPRRV